MKKQFKNKKGGKLIFSGNSCIYNPNLISENYNKRDSNLISKLLPKNEFENEVELVKDLGIHKIDKNNKYFIIPIEADEVIEIDKENDNYLLDCKKFENHNAQNLNRDFIHIIESYGGETLDNTINNINKFNLKQIEEILKNIINLFKGLILLKNNKIFHMDIKPDNIIVDKELNLKIIDFGLATKETNIKYMSFNEPYYRYWSPDFIIFLINKTQFMNTNFIYSHIYKTYNHNLPIKLIEYINNTTVFYFNFINKSNLSINELYKITLNQIDVFSLGVCLFEIFNNKLNYIINKYIDNSGNFELDLINLIIKMLNGDPLKRITIDEAFMEYLIILNKYNLIDDDLYKKEYTKIKI